MNFIFGTTTGSSAMRDGGIAQMLASGEDFTFIDGKASIYPLSKTKAKKRLMAAGLRPSEAGSLVHQIAGQLFSSGTLQAAMRSQRRHARKWFPWDTVINK